VRSAFASWTKATSIRERAVSSTAIGHSSMIAATSVLDLTITGVSTPSRAAIALAIAAACCTGVPPAARKTAFPLLSNVTTST
jgi:hypothetical protein